MNFLPPVVLAANMQIPLREQPNQNYGPQALSHPFSCSSAPTTGPSGTVPAQVSDGRLFFVIDDLAPLATDQYEVTPGANRYPPVAIGDLGSSLLQIDRRGGALPARQA